MILKTTLCYLERDGKYLMLNRNKKIEDTNKGKWLGIGGKFIENETPFECAQREVFEETGLNLRSASYRGVVKFVSNIYPTEYMHLFTSSDFDGELKLDCDEGELKWIEKSKILDLNLWQGDKYFLELLDTESRFFTMELEYNGDILISHKVTF